MTKDQLKAIQKAEKDRSREKRRTLNMFEKLDIDKIKLTPEMIAAEQSTEDKTTKTNTTTNQEMLDSL